MANLTTADDEMGLGSVAVNVGRMTTGNAMSFFMQIGLVREQVTVEGGELSMASLRDIACAFVDRKVRGKI